MDSGHTCEYREKVSELEKRLAAVEAELAEYKKPKKNSGNSGVPPSQDRNRKQYPQREKSGRSPGGQAGHPGHYHPLSENPDEIIPLLPNVCVHCGSLELEVLAQQGEVRQEIDIPPVKEYVREYRQCSAQCRVCGQSSKGGFPPSLRAPVQMSPAIQALTGYLKVHHHLGHQKISHFYQEVLGIRLSEGSVQNILKRLAETLKPTYSLVKEMLKQAFVLHSDESTNKVSGKNGYVWVFTNASLCLFVSVTSRGYNVIEELFGNHFPSVWVSDRYNAQLKVNTRHQLCLAHLIRDCRYLIEAKESQWASDLKLLFQEAIAFRNQHGKEFNPKESTQAQQIQHFQKRLSECFAHPPPSPLENKLFQGLLNRQEQLLLFLQYPDVPPTNNTAEQALRNRVVHRKITGGFRTHSGSSYYDIIASVIETARKQGKNILNVLTQKESLLSIS
jgi:transposase